MLILYLYLEELGQICSFTLLWLTPALAVQSDSQPSFQHETPLGHYAAAPAHPWHSCRRVVSHLLRGIGTVARKPVVLCIPAPLIGMRSLLRPQQQSTHPWQIFFFFFKFSIWIFFWALENRSGLLPGTGCKLHQWDVAWLVLPAVKGEHSIRGSYFRRAQPLNINTFRHNKRRHFKFLAVYKQRLNFTFWRVCVCLCYKRRTQHLTYGFCCGTSMSGQNLTSTNSAVNRPNELRNVCPLNITWMWLQSDSPVSLSLSYFPHSLKDQILSFSSHSLIGNRHISQEGSTWEGRKCKVYRSRMTCELTNHPLMWCAE